MRKTLQRVCSFTWPSTIRVSITMLMALGMISALIVVLHPPATLDAKRATTLPVVLAEYQAWHGLATHRNPPYISTDTLVISRHIEMAQAMGISGFVVDWYGPPAGLSNDIDRAFIDQATTELIHQSEARGFKIALMYDEGTLFNTVAVAALRQTRAISDLLYARRYFTSPAYLNINGHPALFVFPYPLVDPDIMWSQVRSQLGITLTLLDEDPNPGDQQHDIQFDGFYAWVQPSASHWLTDGTEWGHDYLQWFYNVMAGLAPTYTSRVAVGGVWPGFDDSNAPWGVPPYRYIWPRCGQTWRDTWELAQQYQPLYVMIDTWNDFEEDTGIEFGVGDCLAQAQQYSTLPGRSITYSHVLTNTGKFADTFTLTVSSSNGWPVEISPTSTILLSHTGRSLVVTIPVPITAQSGMADALMITVTSQLSPEVFSRVIDSTNVLWGIYLPVIRHE